jgi:SAGA-associated factor 73
VQIPIERQYMRHRLYEQLHNATNGFTVNIFKVVGYGTQKLPPGHPGNEGDGDADGEVDMGAQGLGIGLAGVAVRRASGFNMTLPPQRRPSNPSQR